VNTGLGNNFFKVELSHNINNKAGQEYQPGGVGIYLVVEYFERF
jgi:hypothetical protein